MSAESVNNYIDGQWVASSSQDLAPVHNPVTSEQIGETPLSTKAEVDDAVQAACRAFPEWRRTPVQNRCRLLLKLRQKIEQNLDPIARAMTSEHGKTFLEAKLEIGRALDNIEVAASATTLMMGDVLEDVSKGIDESCIRQPIGCFAALCPFNFPAMIPFWFMPYALATGNTYLVKPSPRVPMTMIEIFKLIDEVGFPPGVVNCVHGAAATAEAILDHKRVDGISFVGSTAVGQKVFQRGALSGKRMQVQAGAKNFAVVMPDAVLEKAIPNIIASAYDCSGQRCLALSGVIAVGDCIEPLREGLIEAAQGIRVGSGLDEGVQMGPVISLQAKERIEGWIGKGIEEGARALLDGRGYTVESYPQGYWVGPTLLDQVTPGMEVARQEIFGPVLCILEVSTLDEALEIIHQSRYGNAAAIFTQNGGSARKFKYEANCGNVGVNIGVAAPMAMFHFGGTKESFFGVLHGQGKDALHFFTEGTVVIERWF